MTKHEKLVISAYTGFLMVDMDELREFAGQVVGRELKTNDLTDNSLWDELKEKLADEYMDLVRGETKNDDLKFELVVERPLSGGSPETMFYRYLIGDFELRFTQDMKNGNVMNLRLEDQGSALEDFAIDVHEEEIRHRVYYPTEFRVRPLVFPRTPGAVHDHLENWKKALGLVGKLEEFFKTSKHYELFCKHHYIERTVDDLLCSAKMRFEDEGVSSSREKQTDERGL